MPEDAKRVSDDLMRCEDCERVDALIYTQTALWFHLPIADSVDKLTALCQRQAIENTVVNERTLRVNISEKQAHSFAVALYGAMSQQELRNVRVVSTDGAEPGAQDIGRILNGDAFVNRIKGKWIIDRARDGHIETWYQPIYKFSDTTTPYGMESLLRMKDQSGNMIPPDFVFRVAKDADVLFSIDLIARATAVQNAAQAGYKGKIFINFNPSSIYDPAYCLRTTAAAINELGLKPSDIVFEITETEKIEDLDHLRGILAFYRRAGFQCALDDIGSGWSSLNLLHTFRPDYVKLDMELIRDVDKDEYKQSIVKNLVNIAKEQQLRVIVEGVETQGEADFARVIGADFVQGYLFSKPAPIQDHL